MKAYSFFKSLAFRLDPELAHDWTLCLAHHFPLSAEFFGQAQIEKKYQIPFFHTNWSFPVGLAAGLDKNALALNFFQRLYFGAIEVGTVTPRPQPGNPKPRLFRYPQEESLRNSFGFNNHGMEAMAQEIRQTTRRKCLGVNIGKNKDTTAERAIEDYQQLYNFFKNTADYIVINVSSPNTPGLRELQEIAFLKELVDSLDRNHTPLFLKISPDESPQRIRLILEFAQRAGLQGLVATNTTISPQRGPGGVSGKLLRQRARAVREQILAEKEAEHFELIGVGGFSTVEDVAQYFAAGGKFLQIYTALIYQGPGFLAQIKELIDQRFPQLLNHSI